VLEDVETKIKDFGRFNPHNLLDFFEKNCLGLNKSSSQEIMNHFDKCQDFYQEDMHQSSDSDNDQIDSKSKPKLDK